MGFLFNKGSTISSEATRLNALQIQQSTYGAAIPIVFGTTRITGNFLDYDDFTAIPHTTTQSSGGKGGGGTTQNNTEYTYTAAMIIGLCEAPVVQIGKVWSSKEKTSLAGKGLELYQNQIWPYMQSIHPDKALAYKDTAYVAGVIDLGSSGEVPNLSFEIFSSFQIGGEIIDALPSVIFRELLINEQFGIGFPPSCIGDLSLYATYCLSSGLFMSPGFKEQQECRENLSAILKCSNSEPIWSQGKIKVIPYGDEVVTGNGVTYTPPSAPLYDLTADDFLPDEGEMPVKFKRSRTADAYNIQPFEFMNRANDYNVETDSVSDAANIGTFGPRTADVVAMHFFCEKAAAKTSAQAILQRKLYKRNEYEFKLGYKYYRLEPMDIVTITDDALELTREPVRITEIEEIEEGKFLYTVEDCPEGVHGVTLYPSQTASRSAIDYNADPGDAAAPAIIQLAQNGAKIYIATAGGKFWGGCNVWLADNGDTYKKCGTIAGPSRYGVLSAPLPSGEAIDTINAIAVDLSISAAELLSGSQADAQNLRTLCWVDGELIAYATATLTGDHKYSLAYLVRGCYGTPISSHAAGAQFVRVDESLFGIPYQNSDVGKLIYVKLQSFNIFNAGIQNLAEIPEFMHTIDRCFVPHVFNLNVVQAYREVGDGTISYELTLTWDTPDAAVYAESDVYVRSNLATDEELGSLTAEEIGNVPVDRIGLDIVPWKQIGTGKTKLTYAGASIGATYKFMVLAKNSSGATADMADAPTIEYTVAVKPYTPTMPSGFVLNVSDRAFASWNANVDTDIDYYELRFDNNPGVETNRLYRGSAIECNPTLQNREGTLYLFAHNPSGHYSGGLRYDYKFAAPNAPAVNITGTFQGFIVSTDAFPSRAISLNVHINDGTGDQIYASPNNYFKYSATEGSYEVKAAFVDYFGEGILSGIRSVTIAPTIDSTLLSAELQSLEQSQQTIMEAVDLAQHSVSQTTFNDVVNTLQQADAAQASNLTQTSEGLTSVVTELNKEIAQCSYTAIFQALTAINLRATKENLISQINVCPEALTLASKLIHLAGDTLIDDNLIVGRMIATKTITADNILSLLGMIIPASDGSCTKFDADGINWYSPTGVKYGSVKRAVQGTALNGKFIQFSSPWQNRPFIILSPKSVQTMVSGYTNSNLQIVCEPYSNDAVNDPDMKTGFRIRLETRVLDGSGGSVIDLSLGSDGAYQQSPNTPQATKDLYATVEVNLGSYTAGYYQATNPAHYGGDLDAPYTYRDLYNSDIASLNYIQSPVYWTKGTAVYHSIDSNTQHTHHWYRCGENGDGPAVLESELTHYHREWINEVYTYGTVAFNFYYRLVGSSTWISAGSFTFSNNYGVLSHTQTLATGLTPGQYQILVVRASSAGTVNAAKFKSYAVNGGGVIASTGEVSFLAIESDGNSFYSVES